MPLRFETSRSARPSRRPNHGRVTAYPHDRADGRTRSPLRLRAGRNSQADGSSGPRSETGRIVSDGRSCPEKAPQRLEKIESGPGNGMVSEALSHYIWYLGARPTVRAHGQNRLVPKPPASPATVASLRKKREGNFPACKALISRETGKESRQLAVRPKPPVGPEAGRIAIDGRDAPKRPGGKFSCLQSIEKSRNQKILDR